LYSLIAEPEEPLLTVVAGAEGNEEENAVIAEEGLAITPLDSDTVTDVEEAVGLAPDEKNPL
jgi:hypothetical protein